MLEHCHEEEINCCFSIFRMFPFSRISKATKDIKVNPLFTVAIPVNYTSQFLEMFEGDAYNTELKTVLSAAVSF
jgi:hypothetical protein